MLDINHAVHEIYTDLLWTNPILVKQEDLRDFAASLE